METGISNVQDDILNFQGAWQKFMCEVCVYNMYTQISKEVIIWLIAILFRNSF